MLHAQGMDADLSPDITEHTSNLELIYITAGSDHKELAERLKAMQHMDRQERLGSAADGSIALSRTFVAPTFTAEKKSRCDIKFVRWLVRKNRPLSMSKKSLGCQFHGSPASGGRYTSAGKRKLLWQILQQVHEPWHLQLFSVICYFIFFQPFHLGTAHAINRHKLMGSTHIFARSAIISY